MNFPIKKLMVRTLELKAWDTMSCMPNKRSSETKATIKTATWNRNWTSGNEEGMEENFFCLFILQIHKYYLSLTFFYNS